MQSSIHVCAWFLLRSDGMGLPAPFAQQPRSARRLEKVWEGVVLSDLAVHLPGARLLYPN